MQSRANVRPSSMVSSEAFFLCVSAHQASEPGSGEQPPRKIASTPAVKTTTIFFKSASPVSDRRRDRNR